MNACLLVAGAVLALAESRFTLEWTHSVEHTAWREVWVVEAGSLRLLEAAVLGSGAGMEPGDGAILRDGWWVWQPALPLQPALSLAASGATAGGWRLCTGGVCQVLGSDAGVAVALAPCPPAIPDH